MYSRRLVNLYAGDQNRIGGYNYGSRQKATKAALFGIDFLSII
jgi:hypothetical protein